MKGQIDEFVFVLFAGLILIAILLVTWSSEAAIQITVLPESKYLTIARGSSLSFPIFMNGSAKNVTLSGSGNIANWISFDRASLDVSKQATVIATVTVPAQTSFGTHSGDIFVQTLGFEKRISIVVNVSARTVSSESRSINFGDFTVFYASGPETIAEKENLRTERGYFTDSPASFAAIVPQERLSMVTDGYIDIIVDQTNGLGNLIIEVNGNETFNQKVGVGETIIPLSKEQITRSNSVVLMASTPGLVFWSSSVYEIGSAKFAVNYNGTAFKDLDFMLDSLELVNFKSGRLSFFVKNSGETEHNLIISINGQTIFEGIPSSYFSKTFGSEVNLNAISNTISFSTDPDTFYELEDVTLSITTYA